MTRDVTCPDFTWTEKIWGGNVRWTPSYLFSQKNFILRCLIELWIRLWWHTPNFISAENIIGLESQHKKWSLQLWISSVNVTQSASSLRIWSHLLRKSVMENLFVNIIKHKNNFLPQNTYAHKNRQENHKVRRLYLRNIVSHFYIDAVARNNAIFL